MLYSNHGMGTFYDIVHILQLGMYQQWVVHPMPSQRKTDYCKNISWGYIPVYTNLCIYIYAIMEQKQQTQANAAREISTVAKIVSMSKYGHPRKTRQNSLSVITWPFIYCNPPVPRFVQCRHKMRWSPQPSQNVRDGEATAGTAELLQVRETKQTIATSAGIMSGLLNG